MNMALDWDINLIDIIRVKMCGGCKFENECHPPESRYSMEMMNLAQMGICAEENVMDKYRPIELTYMV